MTAKSVNTLKLRELRISYEEDAISVTLNIESLSTLSSVIPAAETRFKEIRNMIK